MIKHEEKETDVAMSTKIFELLINDKTDTIIIISGDTDLAPVIRTVNKFYPKKKILFGFPYKRFNHELKQLVTDSFSISKEQYVNHQFPDKIIYENKELLKPNEW